MNTGSLNALAVRGRSGGSPSAATAHCGLLKYGPCQCASSPSGRAGQQNRRGVGIETPGEGVVRSIVDGMRAVLDAEQLEDLKRHTRRGMGGRIQAGLSAGGLTYGYAPGQDKGKLVLVEHEAAVVRRIFAEYVHGRFTHIDG